MSSETDIGEDRQDEDRQDEEKQKLDLDVQIESPSSCERHIVVTIAAPDVQRYFDDVFTELMPSAEVPGFRAGRAPRKLVEQRFRDDVKDRVKSTLLMDTLQQVTDELELSAISEPDFDFDAIEVPDEGPMKFEFDLEVRPEFDMPDWKGLQIERPVRDIGSDEIDQYMNRLLSQFANLVPHDGSAESGDVVVANITVKHDGRVIAERKEETLRLANALSFPDADIDDFDKLMAGVAAGETRTTEVMISHEAPVENLQGETVEVAFAVLEVKKVELPELDDSQLNFFGVANEGEMRDLIAGRLKSQLAYRQEQRVREQITELLTESADWDLPPELLKRQSKRELDRALMELRSSGFDEEQVQAYANELRQNTLQSTEKALKEHFILERIAEEQDIEDVPGDYEVELQRMANQSGETVRRVRAKLEKRGLMDSLRNQIIERKVIQRIKDEANFKDVEFDPKEKDEEASDFALSGRSASEIPEAKGGGEAQKLQEPADHS